MLKRLRELLCSVIAPVRCPVCKKILHSESSFFCPECQKHLPWVKEKDGEFVTSGKAGKYVSGYAAPFYYKDDIRLAFSRFKFQNKPVHAHAFGICMAECWRRAAESSPLGDELMPDVITWVPVSKKRKRDRGYDQSELLAKCVGEELGIPVVPLLEKTGDNKPQSTLDAFARAGNVIGMYETRADGTDITGKTVLLIDDILTTGATVKEASFVLDGLRPKRIFCLFAAKTDKSRPKDTENFHPSGKNG